MPHGANEAAVPLLHLQKLRHGGLQAQVFRITSVDTANHRLGDAPQRLTAQSTGVTKCARDSSAVAVRRGSTESSAMRSFPRQLSMGEAAKDHSEPGTIR